MRNLTMAKDNVANNEAMPTKDSICTSQISLFTKIFISILFSKRHLSPRIS